MGATAASDGYSASKIANCLNGTRFVLCTNVYAATARSRARATASKCACMHACIITIRVRSFGKPTTPRTPPAFAEASISGDFYDKSFLPSRAQPPWQIYVVEDDCIDAEEKGLNPRQKKELNLILNFSFFFFGNN